MRAGAVVEHYLFEGHYQAAGITRLAGLSQATQPCLDIAFRHAVAYENADLLMGGGYGVLKYRVQLFVELLTGAHAGKFDLDVFIRLQARQEDQVLGEVDNLDRLAHVEDADLTAFSDDRGLQHELPGFGNGHEKAPHIGMRHGHRSARRDLLLEDGDDAAVRAEHISKAHGHVLGPPVLQRQQQKFGDAFGGAHDVRGPHCFIGGDHDEVFDSVLRRRHGHVVCPEDVVLEASKTCASMRGTCL